MAPHDLLSAVSVICFIFVIFKKLDERAAIKQQSKIDNAKETRLKLFLQPSYSVNKATLNSVQVDLSAITKPISNQPFKSEYESVTSKSKPSIIKRPEFAAKPIEPPVETSMQNCAVLDDDSDDYSLSRMQAMAREDEY